MTGNWTEDEGQCTQFLRLVGPVLDQEVRYHARKYGVSQYMDDIAVEAQLLIWAKLKTQPPVWPFDRDTPKESADLAREKYRLREWVRSIARKKAREESRQARLLKGVELPRMPEDQEKQLMSIARRLPEISKEIPGLTGRDDEILRLEGCRRAGMDGLTEVLFDEAARAAGVEPEKLRAHIRDFDQSERLSDRDRKAWSRVKSKVSAASTPRSLLSLLFILLALLAATCSARPDEPSVALHQGPGEPAAVCSHQAPGKPVAVASHQGPGKHLQLALHQSADPYVLASLHQGLSAPLFDQGA